MRRAPLLFALALAAALGLLWLALRNPLSPHSGEELVAAGPRGAPESTENASPLNDMAVARRKRVQPPVRIVVHVQDGDGRPVAGAEVRLGEPEGAKASPSERRKPATLWHVLGHFFGLMPRADGPFARTAPSDSEGTAVLEVNSLPQRYLELQAVGPEVEGRIQARSEPIALDRNSREEHVLTVLRPAIVRVRLEPRMANASVDLSLSNEWTRGPTLSVPSAHVQGSKPVTSIAIEPRRLGMEECTFAVFAAGEYRVSAWLQRGTSSAVQKVLVERLGTEHAVALAFPGRLALAVRGRVLDENGKPSAEVELTCKVDGQSAVKFASREDGSFEWWHAPGSEIALRPPGSTLYAQFQPDELRLPFGARDAEFQARPPPPEVDVHLDVVDADTHRAIYADVSWSVRTGSIHRVRNDGKLFEVPSTVRVPRLPGLELLVCAQGFADDRQFVFSKEKPGMDGPLELRVELTRGFRRAFRVERCISQRPLAGARLLVDGQVLAVTDAEGMAYVERPAWPAELSVELDGYQSESWPSPMRDPASERVVRLCPID